MTVAKATKHFQICQTLIGYSLLQCLDLSLVTVKMEEKSQDYCLKWDQFQSNLALTFDQLRRCEDFVDVTLSVGGNSIKCHKVRCTLYNIILMIYDIWYMHIYNIMYNISTLDVVKLAKYDNLLNKHFALTKQRNIFAYLLSDKNSIFLILFFLMVYIELYWIT